MSTEHAEMAMLARAVRFSAARQPIDNDWWGIDAPESRPGERDSYDFFFRELLAIDGFRTFEEQLGARKEEGKPTHVADIFGSCYFIEDQSVVDSMTGVRLGDASWLTVQRLQAKAQRTPLLAPACAYAEQRIAATVASPKWGLVPGNVFRYKTWDAVDANMQSRDIPFFDVSVLKPEGAIFANEVFPKDVRPDVGTEQVDRIYSAKFLYLINRVYKRTSPNVGMIYTEVPDFISARYLNDFTKMLRVEGDVQADAVPSRAWHGRSNLRLIKYPSSTPDLEALTRSQFQNGKIVYTKK